MVRGGLGENSHPWHCLLSLHSTSGGFGSSAAEREQIVTGKGVTRKAQIKFPKDFLTFEG